MPFTESRDMFYVTDMPPRSPMTGATESAYPKSTQSVKSDLQPATYRGLASNICPTRNVPNTTNRIFSYRSLNTSYRKGKLAERQKRQAAEVMRELQPH